MRRTDREFKEELQRRTKAYRAQQKKRRKMMLTAALCLVLCVFTLTAVPAIVGGGFTKSADNAAAAGVVYDMESSISQADTNGAAGEMTAEEPAAAAEPEEDTGKMSGSSSATAAQPEVCVRNISSEEMTALTAADAATLVLYLQDGWIDGAVNCLPDCVLLIDGTEIRYHSDCGTFSDLDAMQCLTVSEEDRLIINGILETYMELGY